MPISTPQRAALGPTAGAVLRDLHAVQGAGASVSRAELTARLGVSAATMGEALAGLADAGLVQYAGTAPRAGRGRPSPLVRVQPLGRVAVAVTVSVDTVQVAIVGLGGAVVDVVVAPWTADPPSPEAAVEDVERHVTELFARRPGAAERCVGAGVAVYGLTRADRSTVSAAPNLGWRDVPLGADLRERLGMPVVVANNSHAGAFAEYRRGAGVGSDQLLYLTGDVGIGGAVVTGGRLLLGHHGFGGEVGHMTVNPGGVRCRCGNIGCWETEIDRRALARHAGVAESGAGTALRQETAAVLAAAAAGRREAVAAVAALASWFATGLGNLVQTLDPQRVVMANFLADLLPLVRPQLTEHLRARILDEAATLPELVAAGQRDRVEIIGAAELAFDAFLGPSLRGDA